MFGTTTPPPGADIRQGKNEALNPLVFVVVVLNHWTRHSLQDSVPPEPIDSHPSEAQPKLIWLA